MFRFMIFCQVWFLHTVLIGCSENSKVIRVSVPEDHHIRLRCPGADSSDVVWTHRDRSVPVTRQGGHETNEDPQRYLLLPDGSLQLLHLDESDSGEYHCNQQLVAELQVLTGHDFTVSAGRTLLLPCSSSSKHRQRWLYRRREREKWELIFTLFRNGTVKPEREGGRLGYQSDALQIQDLQPEDAGQYQCKVKLGSEVTTLTVQPEPTSTEQTAWTTTTTATTTTTTTTDAVTETDETERKKEKKKRPENALLIVAVAGLGLMVLLLVAVCVLLTGMKCRRRRKKHRRTASQRHEDTELQPWKTSSRQTGNAVSSDPAAGLYSGPSPPLIHLSVSAECEAYESPSLPEETIHYASLGRQNWKERPSRTPPDQNHHNVIYSSVITRPAAK
ncbi:uncharacterized protein LOC127358042 isoform X2 [Dicentrarchus labrax]|uniref:uncharacterized protein LOC127358042 isoform X2 n=1 Tax=Dicentrarchus labrax TaxID=13489 RepID=UPI0021F50221|nr:uncharacterized protein LOC127358042 isoform X2 [Dicentrarchus labrax]